MFSSLTAEHELVLDEIRRRRMEGAVRYPDEFALESVFSLVLYCLVRATRPRVVLETGVADGESTMVILSALARNGAGWLYSIDTDPGAGALVTGSERGRWTLLILNRDVTTPKDSLRQMLKEIPTPCLMFHDSDHSYSWQSFEYREFRRIGGEASILASDDVDDSYAFLDFCREHSLSPTILVGKRKAFGLTKVRGSRE